MATCETKTRFYDRDGREVSTVRKIRGPWTGEEYYVVKYVHGKQDGTFPADTPPALSSRQFGRPLPIDTALQQSANVKPCNHC